MPTVYLKTKERMKKLFLNSKGLTMIELVFSLALGSVVVLTALGFLSLTQSQQKKLLASTSSMISTPIEREALCYWHGNVKGTKKDLCQRLEIKEKKEDGEIKAVCSLEEKAKELKEEITKQLNEASGLGFPKDFFGKEKAFDIEAKCRFMNKNRTMYLSHAYLLAKDFGLKSKTVAECAQYVSKKAQEEFDKEIAEKNAAIEQTVRALREVDEKDEDTRKGLEKALHNLQAEMGKLELPVKNQTYLRLSLVFEVKSFKRAVPKDKDALKKFLATEPHKLDIVPLSVEVFERDTDDKNHKWYLQLADVHNLHNRVWEVNSQGCSVPLARRFWVGEGEEGEEYFTLATKDNDKRIGHLLKGVGGTFGGVFHRAIDDHDTLYFSTLKKAYQGRVLASRGKRGGWPSNWGKRGDDCHQKAKSGQKFPDSLKYNMHTGQKSFDVRRLPCPDGFAASPMVFGREQKELVEEHGKANPCHSVMFTCVPAQGCPSECSLDPPKDDDADDDGAAIDWHCNNARVTGQCDLEDEKGSSSCPDRYIQDARARCAEITD